MTLVQPAIAASGTAVQNTTGQHVAVTVTGGTVSNILVGYGTNPQPLVGNPAVPATTVPITNANPFPVAVAITQNGATITAITINGSSQGTAAAPTTYVVPAGGTIAISYTVATPTWVWSALAYGVSGNPVSSPFSVPVFPGCAITLTYSVAPTWNWLNPLAEGYTPGFQYPFNSGAEAAGYDPTTILPYAKHAQAGQTGLSVGVAN